MSDGRTLRFSFEGRPVEAREGQTIAGALHAAGIRTLSRGVKYHRPRGYTCGFGACGDCPLRVDGMPATTSCTVPVRGGEAVRREGGVPGVGFDLLRTADLLRPFLRAGFQFRLFAGQPRLSRLAGAVLAVLAGGGRAPSRAAAERSTILRAVTRGPDVLVIGGGASGLAAAIGAADAGAEVLVVDQELGGGRGLVRTEPVRVGGSPCRAADVVAELLDRAAAHPGIELLRGTAVGLVDGLVPVLDAGGRTRHDVRPRAVVLATGSYETPVLVPGHDLPGVMLADGALRLASVEGVAPGRRAVVVEDDPRAAAVADELRRHGVDVVARVPAAEVARVTGWARATGVRLRPAGRARGRRLRADLVCLVGPRRAAEELVLHAAYGDAGSHDLVGAVLGPRDDGDPVAVVGSARGSAVYDTDEAAATGARLARDAIRRRPVPGAAASPPAARPGRRPDARPGDPPSFSTAK